MVKGISRQVILVKGPEAKLFDQAIFILKDDTPAVTDEALIREARALLRSGECRSAHWRWRLLWASGGSMVTGLIWWLTALL